MKVIIKLHARTQINANFCIWAWLILDVQMINGITLFNFCCDNYVAKTTDPLLYAWQQIIDATWNYSCMYIHQLQAQAYLICAYIQYIAKYVSLGNALLQKFYTDKCG